MKPHTESLENPLYKTGAGFTHYEIQTVREYQAPDGCRFFEPCMTEDDCDPDAENNAGPVLFGLYGRLNVGGVEHIADYDSLAKAHHTLCLMGIMSEKHRVLPHTSAKRLK